MPATSPATPARVKLCDLAVKAVRENDAKAAACVSDALRMRNGMNYKQIFDFVQQLVPEATLPEWDALLGESEEVSG
jgi:hypothetical protein